MGYFSFFCTAALSTCTNRAFRSIHGPYIGDLMLFSGKVRTGLKEVTRECKKWRMREDDEKWIVECYWRAHG
jgi:hypothetical protein